LVILERSNRRANISTNAPIKILIFKDAWVPGSPSLGRIPSPNLSATRILVDLGIRKRDRMIKASQIAARISAHGPPGPIRICLFKKNI
jgi:hypothetical protein